MRHHRDFRTGESRSAHGGVPGNEEQLVRVRLPFPLFYRMRRFTRSFPGATGRTLPEAWATRNEAPGDGPGRPGAGPWPERPYAHGCRRAQMGRRSVVALSALTRVGPGRQCCNRSRPGSPVVRSLQHPGACSRRSAGPSSRCPRPAGPPVGSTSRRSPLAQCKPTGLCCLPRPPRATHGAAS